MPPVLTLTGREEVANGGTIDASLNDQHVLFAPTEDCRLTVQDGATPSCITFNIPSHVEGHDDNEAITYTYYQCTVRAAAAILTIGRVKGDKGTQGGATTFNRDPWTGFITYRLGNADDYTWGSNIAEDCHLEKKGTACLTLGGKGNTYTGKTAVEKGTLRIKEGVLLGKGVLEVKAGATLSGHNKVDLTNAKYCILGTLSPGSTLRSGAGVLSFGGKNVTFGSKATLLLAARRCATAANAGCSTLKNIGTMTMNGTVDVRLTSDAVFAPGDSIRLWTATTCAGTPRLASYIVDEAQGLYWDDSDLARGILRVTDIVPTAIDAPLAAAPQAVYTTSGTYLGGALPQRRGTYVVRTRDGRSRKIAIK